MAIIFLYSFPETCTSTVLANFFFRMSEVDIYLWSKISLTLKLNLCKFWNDLKISNCISILIFGHTSMVTLNTEHSDSVCYLGGIVWPYRIYIIYIFCKVKRCHRDKYYLNAALFNTWEWDKVFLLCVVYRMDNKSTRTLCKKNRRPINLRYK